MVVGGRCDEVLERTSVQTNGWHHRPHQLSR